MNNDELSLLTCDCDCQCDIRSRHRHRIGKKGLFSIYSEKYLVIHTNIAFFYELVMGRSINSDEKCRCRYSSIVILLKVTYLTTY